jgi:hypothetical protein
VAGAVLTHRLASLRELETVYSYEDMLDLYEVLYVNDINAQRLAKK